MGICYVCPSCGRCMCNRLRLEKAFHCPDCGEAAEDCERTKVGTARVMGYQTTVYAVELTCSNDECGNRWVVDMPDDVGAECECGRHGRITAANLGGTKSSWKRIRK